MASPHVAGVVALSSAPASPTNGDGPSPTTSRRICVPTRPRRPGWPPTDAPLPELVRLRHRRRGQGARRQPAARQRWRPGSAPTAVDDAATTNEDTATDIAVLANDTDPDGDALSVTAVTDPPLGTATVNPDGTVPYIPDANYNGPDTFDYTVSDGDGRTDTGSVAVTVTAVNDPPVAVDDMPTTPEDASTLDRRARQRHRYRWRALVIA